MNRCTILAVLALCTCGDPEPAKPAAAQSEAQKLLTEAGYPEGRGFPTLSILYNTSDWHKSIAEVIQERWRTTLGIDVELINCEWKVYMQRVDSGDFQIARRGWIGEYLDPQAFLELMQKDSGSNATGWEDPEYERIVLEAQRERNPERRLQLLARAEKILLEAAPIAPIHHYVAHNYMKPFIRGVHHNSRDLHPLQGVTLEGEGRPDDGVLLFNGGEEPGTLDPALSHDIGGLKILMHLFEGLCSYDPKDASPIPGVAERWEVSEDGLTWTFHLRESHWSNGEPLTAADFVYAWRRVVDPKTASPYAHRMFVVRNGKRIFRGEAPTEELGVRAPDERTLVVDLEYVSPFFPQLLCLNLFYPVHRATVEKHGDRWAFPERMVHNGPYRLTSWKVNDKKVFEKNPRYRDPASVKLEKFVFLSVPDHSTGLRMYEANQCHWLFQVPPAAVEAMRSRPDHTSGPYNGVYFYAFNTKVKPLDDPRVRRAFSLSIDREAIVEAILHGGETPAHRFVPPTASPAPLP